MQKHFQQAKDSIQPHILYVVATPIGNLADITLRALAVLSSSDLICAEDTRVTGQLLSAYGLKKKLVNVREHNEAQMAEQIINALQSGQIVAQVSDAGTPAVCDPGARLVASVREAGFKVCPVVGASAVIGGLSVAGMLEADFYFGGFLPAKSTERQKIIANWQNAPYPVIVYETPHRILDALKDLQSVLGGERYIVIARELTKTFETILAGSIDEVLLQVQSDSNQTRGEFVVIISGNKPEKVDSELSDEAKKAAEVIVEYLGTKQTAEVVAKLTGDKKKAVYEYALELKS